MRKPNDKPTFMTCMYLPLFFFFTLHIALQNEVWKRVDQTTFIAKIADNCKMGENNISICDIKSQYTNILVNIKYVSQTPDGRSPCSHFHGLRYLIWFTASVCAAQFVFPHSQDMFDQQTRHGYSDRTEHLCTARSHLS